MGSTPAAPSPAHGSRLSATVTRRERALTAVAVGLLVLVQVIPDSLMAADQRGSWIRVLGSVAAVIILWFQQSRLKPAAIALVMVTLAHAAAVSSFNVTLFAVAVVVFHALGARVMSAWSGWALAAGCVAVAAMAARSALEPSSAQPFGTRAAIMGLAVTPLILAWMVGRLGRARHQEVAAMRQAIAQSGRERAAAQQIATMTERARIAREMHDVLAHSLSGVVTRADGARYAAVKEPQVAIEALAEISREGRVALADLRSLIGNLRSAVTEPSPLPGQDDLAELVETTRRRGLDVTLSQTGTPARLSAGQGLIVYRVVQESLTNVVKHAGLSARATVVLDWTPHQLEVTVRDGGGGTGTLGGMGSGSGLIGMRERVESLSGQLTTGEDGQGFRVHALIPLEEVR